MWVLPGISRSHAPLVPERSLVSGDSGYVGIAGYLGFARAPCPGALSNVWREWICEYCRVFRVLTGPLSRIPLSCVGGVHMWVLAGISVSEGALVQEPCSSCQAPLVQDHSLMCGGSGYVGIAG